jgi:murein DD-endopeptidase MepM/ murein hydrolase activator NlpD
VPEPHGEAAARAKQLGVGTRRAASRVLTGHVPRSWFEAAPGEPSDELLWPVEGGRFGRGFGHTRKRRRGLQHDGLDIVAEVGTPVRAAASGLVVYSDNGVQGMGNLLMLAHPNGTTTLYAHLEAAYVFAGQQVERGQTIGELGTTGLSRGPHLHFEWRDRGRPRDPAPRIVGRPRP